MVHKMGRPQAKSKMTQANFLFSFLVLAKVAARPLLSGANSACFFEVGFACVFLDIYGEFPLFNGIPRKGTRGMSFRCSDAEVW